MASNPYAIRYATEARMYSLEMLLVASGIVALQRALEKPTLGRLAVVRRCSSRCSSTRSTGRSTCSSSSSAARASRDWRGAHRDAARRAARRDRRSAASTFLPWVPTFLYQRAHTGTPWGTPVLPGDPARLHAARLRGRRERHRGRPARGLAAVLHPVRRCCCSACSAGRSTSAASRSTCASQPETRGVAFVGRRSASSSALTLNYLAGGAFQSRYSAIVFPFFVLLVARGFTTLARSARARRRARCRGGARLRRAACATSRPSARRRGRSRAVLRREAKPGDLVVYCPDQIGPAVHRLAAAAASTRSCIPSFARPGARRLGRLQGSVLAAAEPRTRSRRGAAPRRRAHALVRERARLHHARRNVRSAVRRVRRARRTRLQRTLVRRTRSSRSPRCRCSPRPQSWMTRRPSAPPARCSFPYVIVARRSCSARSSTTRHVFTTLHIAVPLATHDGLLAWDASWYRDIAHGGYDGVAKEGLRFFPLFPMLGTAVSWLRASTRGLRRRCSSPTSSALVLGFVVYQLVLHERHDRGSHAAPCGSCISCRPRSCSSWATRKRRSCVLAALALLVLRGTAVVARRAARLPRGPDPARRRAARRTGAGRGLAAPRHAGDRAPPSRRSPARSRTCAGPSTVSHDSCIRCGCSRIRPGGAAGSTRSAPSRTRRRSCSTATT